MTVIKNTDAVIDKIVEDIVFIFTICMYDDKKLMNMENL